MDGQVHQFTGYEFAKPFAVAIPNPFPFTRAAMSATGARQRNASDRARGCAEGVNFASRRDSTEQVDRASPRPLFEITVFDRRT